MTDDPPGVEGTGTNGPDGGSFGGNAAWLEAAFRTRNWYGSMIAVALSPRFRADGDFLPQVDLLEVILVGGRVLWWESQRSSNRLRLGPVAVSGGALSPEDG